LKIHLAFTAGPIGFAAVLALAACQALPASSDVASAPLTSAFPDARAETAQSLLKQNLIYAVGLSDLYILTYPQGQFLQRVKGYGGYSACSDSRGNVFVTQNNQIVELAHGATKPSQVLADPGYLAFSCSIDPTTGNLAVTNNTGSSGSIAVYQHAQGTPEIFSDPAAQSFNYCGYDDAGDLFADGLTPGSYAFQFAELPAGKSSFTAISINKAVGLGQVQWDGAHITLSNSGRPGAVYRLQISGSSATVVGKTRVAGWAPVILPESWIKSGVFIAPAGTYSRSLDLWSYPGGGKSIKTISGFTGHDRLRGVTVSVAQRKL
jgi:hypothetical protein